jgi:hypothetical protein
MMRDPKKFSAPTEFLPERFLNPDGSLSDSAVEDIDPVFGFGRRFAPLQFPSLASLLSSQMFMWTGFVSAGRWRCRYLLMLFVACWLFSISKRGLMRKEGLLNRV